jgi:hypothetical protein
MRENGRAGQRGSEGKQQGRWGKKTANEIPPYIRESLRDAQDGHAADEE